MKEFYQDKTVLITGASSGIGYDLALLLASYGARLGLSARRLKLLEELQAECAKLGGEAMIFPADVTSESEMIKIKDKMLDKWEFVDIVVGNAGVGGLNPADSFSLDINRKTVEINLLGLANTLIPFVPGMMERQQGYLVGVSSLAAFRGLPNAASYSSTKAAQMVFLESLRVDLRKHNIAVSSIHPGFVKTPMTEHDEFKMPFMVPVRKSSLLIAKAIKKRKARYLYPWQMRMLTGINKRLPFWLYDRLIPKLSGQENPEAKVF